MAERKRFLFVVLVMVFLLPSGCRREDDEVLLRFAPRVGHTYAYTFEVYRSHDPMVVTGDMHVLNKDEDGYGIQFSGALADEPLSRLMIVTDRHNSNDPGYISLNLPVGPVRPGTEWSGEIPWYYEDNYVLDSSEIHLPASYQLLRVEETAIGKVAFIEQTVEADVAVDGLVLHVGQVGVQWDHAGRITQVHPEYDASGKLRVGDLVVGINGQRVTSAGERTWLAEKHIQRPKGSGTVQFTVERDGEEHDIGVVKSIDKLAVLKVFNVRSVLQAAFDVNRGILLSAEASINQEDIAFTAPSEDAFPVVDDYDGFHKFGYLRGKTVYESQLGSDKTAWSLSLVEP